MTRQEEFERNWDRFCVTLKGKMLEEIRKNNLSYAMAKLILKDVVLCWEDDADLCGRWLMEYAREEPGKAERIRRILLKEMQFEEPEREASSNMNMLSYALPVAGGVLGFGVASAFHAGTAVRAASLILPAAALYPVAKAVSGDYAAKDKDEVMSKYMDQLTKYKESVEEIIG